MSEDNLISQQDKCFLRLKSLIKVSAQVSSSLDLDCVLQSIVETSQEVMRSEASSLMLYNPEKDVLEFTIALGSTANQVKGFTVKPGQGIAGWVFQNGKSVLIKDAQNDERFYNQVDDQTGFITHSMACVPLRNQEKSIGVLVAINSLDQKCFNEDDLELFEAFAFQATVAIENARYHKFLIEKERVESELQIAREIQKSFLGPSDFKEAPLELSAWTHSARELGGDFYDNIKLPDGKLAVLIGDVSGKGIPASLYMAQVVSIFRSVISKDTDGETVLYRMNQELCQRSSRGMFVTLVYILIDPVKDVLELTDAGHPYVFYNKKKEGWITHDYDKNMPLAITCQNKFTKNVYKLSEMNMIFAYTDGLLDSLEDRGVTINEFVENRMKSIKEDQPSREVVDYLKPIWKQYADDSSIEDDVTLMIVKI